MQETVIGCKSCKGPCRLVIGEIIAYHAIKVTATYNLWQCEKCGQVYRELCGNQ